MSEKKIIDFCARHLELTLCSGDIERAHRLGKYSNGKNRPIIVKLLRFKDKESILSVGHKMKGTDYAVREDFCLAVRQARAKLIKYAKEQRSPFKLRFDKLHIGDNVYSYESVSDSVKQISSSR